MRDMLGGQPPADVAEVLENLDEEHGAQVFRLLESETAGAVLGEVGEIAVGHLADSAPESVARAVEEMAPDEMADVLEVLPEEQRDSVLKALPREEAREVNELLAHAADTAGGIVTPDFLLFAGDITAAQAVSVLQKSRRERDHRPPVRQRQDGPISGPPALAPLGLRSAGAQVQRAARSGNFLRYPADRPGGSCKAGNEVQSPGGAGGG